MKGPLLIVFLFFVLYLLNNETNLMKGGAEETDNVSYPTYIVLNNQKKINNWEALRFKYNFNHREDLLNYLYEKYVNENPNQGDINFLKKKVDLLEYNALLNPIYAHFETLDKTGASNEIENLSDFFPSPDAEAKTKAEVKAKAEAEAKAKALAEAKAKALAEAEVNAQGEAETKAPAEIEAKTPVEVETKATVETNTNMDVNMDINTNPGPIPMTSPTTSPNTEIIQQDTMTKNEAKKMQTEMDEEIVIKMQQKGKMYSCVLSEISEK